MRSSARALALLCAGAAGVQAVELHVHYSAIERVLSEQSFTEDGRRYVRGTKHTRCNFGYLEHPRVETWQDRLRIHAEFTGRTAVDVFGRCVGMGDAFKVVITAKPAYRDGNIGLREVVVASDGRTSFYIRRVCAALASSLERDFQYPIAAELKRVIEDPSGWPAYRRELKNFNVTDIRVSGDELVIQLDFELDVK